MTFEEAAEILKKCDRFDAASAVHGDIAYQWHNPGEKPGQSECVAGGLRSKMPYVTIYLPNEKFEFQGAKARMLMHLGASQETAWECEECQEMYAEPAPADRICWTCAAKKLGTQSAQ